MTVHPEIALFAAGGAVNILRRIVRNGDPADPIGMTHEMASRILAWIDTLTADLAAAGNHLDARQTELLAANNREVMRRRAAEGALISLAGGPNDGILRMPAEGAGRYHLYRPAPIGRDDELVIEWPFLFHAAGMTWVRQAAVVNIRITVIARITADGVDWCNLHVARQEFCGRCTSPYRRAIRLGCPAEGETWLLHVEQVVGPWQGPA